MSKSNFNPKPTDGAAPCLKALFAIDSTHPAYNILYDAAWLAIHGKLSVSVDSLAFEIKKTPALHQRWQKLRRDKGDAGMKIDASLSAYFYKPKPTVPLWRELLNEEN